jgi:hypothetical protein
VATEHETGLPSRSDEQGPLPAGWVCSTQGGRTFYYEERSPPVITWERPRNDLSVQTPELETAVLPAFAAPAAWQPLSVPVANKKVRYFTLYKDSKFPQLSFVRY